VEVGVKAVHLDGVLDVVRREPSPSL
jgi:hypothetical protein